MPQRVPQLARKRAEISRDIGRLEGLADSELGRTDVLYDSGINGVQEVGRVGHYRADS